MNKTQQYFLDRCQVDPDTNCWLWTKAKAGSHMHGVYSENGKHVYAHRGAYTAFIGPVPIGAYVMHKCDVPACINPEHLVAGTPSDNIRDMVQKGRHARQLSLSEAVLTDIRSYRKSAAELSKQYNIGTATVSRIRNGHACRSSDE